MHNTLRFHVDALYVYPIKACAGLRVARLEFLAHGMVAGDREWVVVDTHGEVVWQGSHPRLALVQPGFQAGSLVLTAPGEVPVTVPPLGGAPACEIRIWNDVDKRMETHTGFDAGPEAAQLLETVAGAKLRLIRLGAAAQSRPCINPVHLVSQLSLSELNQRLVASGGATAETARLRPNVVLGSSHPEAQPFIEEHVARWVWGTDGQENALTPTGKCVRCVVPDVHPDTALVSPATSQAIAALSAQRYPGEASYFGVYAKAQGATALTQGDVLEAELQF